jgi:exodeoxyribonuclease III
MKIISWNVNGLRAVLKKGFHDFLNEYKVDILGLQEIKISTQVSDKLNLNFPGYQLFLNGALRPGYSGTGLLVKNELLKDIKYIRGIGIKEFDDEGRVQILEFKNFYLFNVYFPNANAELSRLNYKQKFNEALLAYILKLKKPVIISGDFNVAHQPLDLARPKANEGVAGYTLEERAFLDKLSKLKFVDSFRLKNNKLVKYSWWSYRALARERNVGWRIDYFWLSDKLKKQVKEADILTEVFGSDHAPVYLQLYDF